MEDLKRYVWGKIDHYVMSWIYFFRQTSRFLFVFFFVAHRDELSRTSPVMPKSGRNGVERKNVEHKMKSQQADNAESCKKISSADATTWMMSERSRKKCIKIKCGMRICALKTHRSSRWTTMMFAAIIKKNPDENPQILARKTRETFVIMDDKSDLKN